MVNYAQNLLIVVGAMVVMLLQDPVLGALVLVAAPGLRLVMRRFVQADAHLGGQGAMEETSALSTAVMESLDGIKIVKIENREAYEEGRVAEVVKRRLAHLVARVQRQGPAPRRPPTS